MQCLLNSGMFFFYLQQMALQSAGILLYHVEQDTLKLFLVHPGGPFWKNKDAGAWSIPKGEFGPEEDALAAAKREFLEETGIALKAEHFIKLHPVKMKNGKVIHAWGAEGRLIPEEISSNTFEMTWKNGRKESFPEIDKGGWFTIEEAKEKVNPSQIPLIDELVTALH